jgi:hypothetical protein
MTITQSFSKLSAVAAGIAIAFALIAGVFATATPARAAALTSAQVSSIISLLQSFGADAATIANVQASLTGGTPTTPSGNPNAGSCPALSRSLQQGSTGADVMALQKFLNSKAATQVSVSGAGSPGMESTFFGPATAAAVKKFQTLNNVSAIGIVGPQTRAAIAAVCGNTTPGPGTPTGPGLSVSAGAQPANALAPSGASRVPFTTFSITNNSGVVQTVNGVTVQRVGLGVDSNLSGVVLVDNTNNVQLGLSKTLNSNHQAVIGDNFTINPGQTLSLTVAGNIAGSGTAQAGQILSLQVVAVNSTAAVSGTLPIMGASHTVNTTLTLGSVSTTTSSFDPGAAQSKNIGDTGIRFTGLKFQAGSAEDIKLYSIRWRQVGSGSASDLANVVTNVNGTTYPTVLDASGRYYTSSFPGGILITKGNSVDIYVQGDVTGFNAAGRTFDFDLDKATDVYFVGQTYGYGISVPSGATPWFNGYVATISGGSVTAISKANSGKGAAQNVAINVSNQPLGGFTTNFLGEAVTVQGMDFTIATSSLTATGDSHFTNISIVDENGAVVATAVDASNSSSGQTFTFSDTLTFPVGTHSYYLQGKIPSTVTGGSFSVSTAPATAWRNVTGQSTGNTVSLSGVGSVTFNSMTVRAGALTVTLDTTPASQNINSGATGVLFANLLLNATQSGEDVRMSSIPVNFTSTGSASNITGCQLYDGSTLLNTSAVNTLVSGTKATFSLNNVLKVTKGTTKSLALKCNVSSQATTSSTYYFSTDTTTSDWSVTGDTSGSTITPTITSANSGTMTVQSASLAVSVDSSSPASTTAAAGTTGQTVSIIKVRATNGAATLTDVGLSLAAGTAANVTNVRLQYNGADVGGAVFGSGQTVATATVNSLALPADTDVKLTVLADFTDIGTGLAGVEGAVIQIVPSAATAIGSTGQITAVGSGSTGGVRIYNSVPVFTYSTTGATLINGVNDLLSLSVAADSKGDVGLYKLTFSVATTTVTVTSPTFTGPNGSVGTVAVTDTSTITVTFDSGSNTADSTVGAGTTKTYTLRGTVAGLTGSNSGSVSVALKADTSASAIAQAAVVSPGLNVWSPLATTSRDITTNDWTNSYALKGCFLSVGLGQNCTARVLSN